MEAENDLSNEAAALADILTWSTDLPAWQRDALRRLSNQTKLEVTDITALVAICKSDVTAVPLDASHIRDPAASQAIVSLGALHSLSHVNALAPGERLSFGKAGAYHHLRRQWRRQVQLRPGPEATLPGALAEGRRDPSKHLYGWLRHSDGQRRLLHRRTEAKRILDAG